jgi:hypothetical protein
MIRNLAYVAIGVVVGMIILGLIRGPRKETLLNQSENDSLKLQLKTSNELRMVYILRIDSLSAVGEALSRKLELSTLELKQVKGRYKNHTPGELETEMERRANGK